jgi:hypothetical protein
MAVGRLEVSPNMKNFLVIDGAENSTHDVFGVNEKLFAIVFPDGTDISFLDEVVERVKMLGLDEEKFFGELYANQLDKKNIQGLHGILHSTGSYCRKKYYPTRKEAEVIRVFFTDDEA